MPRPSRSRNRILDSAHRLFWLHGYHAASLDDILQDARASTGSFYYHFHSKAHILLSLLDEYIRAFQPRVMAPAGSQSSDPVERVMFVLTHYRGTLIKSNFRCGCLLGKVALEIPENQLLEKVSSCFQTWTAAVERSLQDARPPLPPTSISNLFPSSSSPSWREPSCSPAPLNPSSLSTPPCCISAPTCSTSPLRRENPQKTPTKTVVWDTRDLEVYEFP